MRKYEWKSYIIFTFYVLTALFALWVLLSWVNVITHNETDCQYWVFNFFRIFMKGE